MSDQSDHVPSFVVCPPVRCYHGWGSPATAVCGELALWKRAGRHWFDDRFFCDAHRMPVDVPIAGELVLRRVRITADVLLAGTSIHAPHAQAEAVSRLACAVAALGGLLDIHGVISTIGKAPAQASPRPPIAAPVGQP